MPENNKCPSCGATLPGDLPAGLCAACLLAVGLPVAEPAQGEAARRSTIRLSLPPLAEKPGDRIGRYKLLQQIGEGGCGVVYMAEQEEPVRRRVALKVIKPGMDTKEVLGRFEAERQALALMDHSNIAKVLDAGATETGRPFFVMELVRGIPITRYCDENTLNTEQRLKLFIQVCHAIQHAHQKGIIHRDIKPSNILVADHDGVPVPKIIDFGIAKATAGQTLTDKTVFTAFEQFIGTPAYMSPEQAKLSGLDIDTRSDIYSLGVLLYELLTGKTPFDAKKLLEAGLDEIRRIIREEEPPRPSQKLSTLAVGEQTTTAKCRQTDSPRLIHLVRGDLDWIVMKCLEKDRNRRYETANGLASDLLRHVNNEPVVARPPSNMYRFQKLVRRNKLVFAASGAVCAALILGLGLSVWFLIKEKQQRAIAETALRESKASEAKARTAEKSTETMTRQLLEGQKLNHTDKPNWTNDETWFRSVMQLQRRVLGEESVDVVATMCNVAYCLDNEHKPDEAEAVMREALALREKIPGEELPNVAAVLTELGDMLSQHGKMAEAMASLRRAFVLFQQNITNNPLEAINTLIIGQNPIADMLQLTNLADLQYAQKLYQKEEEAALFLQKLREQGQIPGWSKDEHGTLNMVFWQGSKMTFDPETYPVSIPFTATKQNDASTYHCIVMQASKDSAWKMQRAWRTSSDGKLIAEYSISTVGEYSISKTEVYAEQAKENAEQPDGKSSIEARMGHWQVAATNFTRSIAANPTNQWNWFCLAPVLIQAGDLSGYRKECHAMLLRFGETQDPGIADRTAKVCLLLPSAVSAQELATVGKLAERAVDLGTNSPWMHWFQLAKGLAEYRQGQFSRSVESMQRIQKGIGAANDPMRDSCEADSYMILAMSLQRLEKPEEARAALSHGVAIVHTKLPALNGGDLGQSWYDVVTAYILMREANDLIEGQPADGKEKENGFYVIGPVTVSPAPLVAGNAVTIQYVATGRNLASANSVYIHLGWNHWNPPVSPDAAMTFNSASNWWQYTVPVPANATNLNCVFNDGQNNWDNNGGADWNFAVSTNSTP